MPTTEYIDEADAPADEIATRRGVSLYQEQVDAVKIIQTHYGLDNFSQAVRRAITNTAAQIDAERDTAV